MSSSPIPAAAPNPDAAGLADHLTHTVAGQVEDLLAALAAVPDPRPGGGRRHPVGYVLAVTLMAFTATGFAHLVGAAGWAAAASTEMLRRLGAKPDPLTGQIWPPSEATIRRVIDAADPDALHSVFTQWLTRWAPDPLPDRNDDDGDRHDGDAPTRAVALDGKTLRGTGNGKTGMTALLAAATHTDGIVLAQTVIPTGTSEIGSVAAVLDALSLDEHTVVTLDALHTIQATALAIRQRRAHYLMTVKGNAAALRQAIATELAGPLPDPDQPEPDPARAALTADVPDQTTRISEHTSSCRGHGRTEERIVRVGALPVPGVIGEVTFPDATHILRIVRYRGGLDGQRTTKEVAYAITSLPAGVLPPTQLGDLVRGHWSIENKVHHVRDVTFGEDHQRARTGNAPAVLATLRNIVIAVIRRAGLTNTAAARRSAALDPHLAITWYAPAENPEKSPL
jgi:predicted transposase YbfD/YdcC